ncbi:MAG: coproporphyrinogen dehydrogenase HemZ [Clostridia bacterium]|nr:coproporphyrinogen dehydrogenase HemZ [Clostridia bacterium]
MYGNDIVNPWGTLYGVRPVKRVADMLRAGADEGEIYRFLREKFEISDIKIALSIAIARKELELTKAISPKDVAIYLDIPFCPTKCAYCSFVSMSAERLKEFAEPYLAAIYKEIDTVSKIVKDLSFTVRSIYIGGGTPTTLLAIELDNLLYKLRQSFDTEGLWEFTLEAGRPDTITEQKLSVMKKHGVTRVSINPQTIHEKTLIKIGRKHTTEDIYKAVSLAKDAGIPILNMDVIAGLPDETLTDFVHTLESVASLQPENITIHTMSIKRASRLKEEAFTPDEKNHLEASKMLNFAYPFMKEHNYEGYYLYRQKNTLGNLENTGFCLDGTACLYNIGMMQELMPIMGIGVGAVTKLLRPGRLERIFNVNDVLEYLNRQDEMRKRKDYIYEFYAES